MTAHTFRLRFVDLILRSDTAPTRFFLGVAALLWALGLALPGDTYPYMMQLAPEPVWALAWLFYGAATMWRVFTADECWRCGFSINALGVGLWSYSSFSSLATLAYSHPAGTAPDFACLGAAMWVFARTHILPHGGWRGD